MLLLLERVEFLDKSSSDDAHSLHDILVEQLDEGRVFLGLTMSNNMMIHETGNNKDSPEGKHWVNEPDLFE